MLTHLPAFRSDDIRDASLLFGFNPLRGLKNATTLLHARNPVRQYPPSEWVALGAEGLLLSTAGNFLTMDPSALILRAGDTESMLKSSEEFASWELLTRLTSKRMALATPYTAYRDSLPGVIADELFAFPSWQEAVQGNPITVVNGLPMTRFADLLMRFEIASHWHELATGGYFDAENKEDDRTESQVVKGHLLRFVRLLAIAHLAAMSPLAAQIQMLARLLKLPMVSEEFERVCPGRVKKDLAVCLNIPVSELLQKAVAGSGVSVGESPYSLNTTYVGVPTVQFTELKFGRPIADFLIDAFSELTPALARAYTLLLASNPAVTSASSTLGMRPLETGGRAAFYGADIDLVPATRHALGAVPVTMRDLSTTKWAPAKTVLGSVFRCADVVLTARSDDMGLHFKSDFGMPVADGLLAPVRVSVPEVMPDLAGQPLQAHFSGHSLRPESEWQGETVQFFNATVDSIAAQFGMTVQRFLQRVAERPAPWASTFVPLNLQEKKHTTETYGLTWEYFFAADDTKKLPLLQPRLAGHRIYIDEEAVIKDRQVTVTLGGTVDGATPAAHIIPFDLPRSFLTAYAGRALSKAIPVPVSAADLQFGLKPEFTMDSPRPEARWIADMQSPNPGMAAGKILAQMADQLIKPMSGA